MEAITAFNNESLTTSILNQLAEDMQTLEGIHKNHITKLGSNINKHTILKIDDMTPTAIEQHQGYHAFLLHKLQLLTSVIQDYNTNMSIMGSFQLYTWMA